MGNFRVPQNTITFELTGDYAGAELTCRRGVSLATFFALQRMSRGMEEGNAEDADALVDLFANEVVRRWNFEDEDGTPMPVTADTLRSLPLDLLMTLVGRWVELAVSVPVPLGPVSSDGATLPVALTNGAA